MLPTRMRNNIPEDRQLLRRHPRHRRCISNIKHKPPPSYHLRDTPTNSSLYLKPIIPVSTTNKHMVPYRQTCIHSMVFRQQPRWLRRQHRARQITTQCHRLRWQVDRRAWQALASRTREYRDRHRSQQILWVHCPLKFTQATACLKVISTTTSAAHMVRTHLPG